MEIQCPWTTCLTQYRHCKNRQPMLLRYNVNLTQTLPKENRYAINSALWKVFFMLFQVETSASNSLLVDYGELSDSENDFGEESEDDYEESYSKRRKVG